MAPDRSHRSLHKSFFHSVLEVRLLCPQFHLATHLPAAPPASSSPAALCSADVSFLMLAAVSGPRCRHAPAVRPVGSPVQRLPVDYVLPAKTSLRTQQA